MSTTVSVGDTTTALAAPPLVGFRHHLRVECRPDRVYLFGERGVRVLHGAAVAAIAPLLDGSRDVPGVLADAPADLDPDHVLGLLARLVEAGLVVPRPTAAPPGADPAALAYWEGAGVDAAEAVAATAAGALSVVAVGALDPAGVVAALGAAGLTVAEVRTASGPDFATDPTADLSVVVCDDYLRPELDEVDRAHRLAGRPWLLAKPVGALTWLGPVFPAVEPGCWHCLAVRLRAHRSGEAAAQEELGRRGPAVSPSASIPAVAATAHHLVAMAAAKWLAGHRDAHQRGVWTFDSVDLTGRLHELRARPQCAACGDPELMRAQAGRPVVPHPVGKVSDTSGGHRALTPAQVRARYDHLVSPVTGIIKEIRRDDRGPAFFNSFRSGVNVAPRVRDLDTLRAVLRVENGGKGVTAEQAEVSALCEAIERYSGNFHGDEARVRGSRRSLGDATIHPNDCQLYDPRQFRGRDAWNAEHAAFQYVAEPFDDDTVTDWTPVWSLTQRRHRLLPTGLLYFGTPAVHGHPIHADSNGNAAGASLPDALLQGLLEVVERDAVALWWYNRDRLPAVDLDACTDPWIGELREVYAGLHREVWVLDLTTDLGVPTMAAVSRRTDGGAEDIMFGFGAHLDPAIALRRALTELNQLMPAVVDAGDGGAYGCDDPDALRWWRTATVAGQPYVAPDPDQRPRRTTEYDYVPCADISAEIAAVGRTVEALGMELLVLDQTRPDIGLPVVKVIVPGMRHFWARFAPGRLFDVPVRLGRRATPVRYAELNPIPMFL